LASRAWFLKVIQVDPKTIFKMTDRLPFGEGASINRPPLFCGLNYQFWKVRMDLSLWNHLTKEFGMQLKMVLLSQSLKKMDLSLKSLGLNELIQKARRPNSIALPKI